MQKYLRLSGLLFCLFISFSPLVKAKEISSQKIQPNKETITVKFVNKSNTVFQRMRVSNSAGYEFIEGGLPLKPGESMTLLIVKKPVDVSLSPNCPPGVCNYTARCGFAYRLTAGTWIAQNVESTPVGPMIECHKG